MDLYGKLNEEVISNDYTGKNSDTANTTINNTLNLVEVNVKKVPNALTLNVAGVDDPITYDGSQAKEVDIVSDESFFELESRVIVNESDIEDLKDAVSDLQDDFDTLMTALHDMNTGSGV